MRGRVISIGGLAAVTAALIVTASRPAEGTYENARAVGKRCMTCHLSVRPNAGTLNETGRYYQLRRTLDGAPGLATPAVAGKPAASTGKPAPKTGTKAGTTTGPGAGTAAAAGTFTQMCAPCHGASGEGTPTGKAFRNGPVAAQSPAAISRTIREGVPNTAMIGFKRVLSAAQIEALARHVATLAKAP